MTPYVNPDALVSTAWLADHANDPSIRIIDASWHHPSHGLAGRDDYLQGHIPGAVFFDIDAIADRSLSLPHMAPDAESFAAGVEALGLGSEHRQVVYDRSAGAAAAARVWWTFRLFGHDNITLLDGGFPLWQAEGRAVESGTPAAPAPSVFRPAPVPALIRSKAEMMANLSSGAEQVLDARSAPRFRGDAVEPWPHIKVGHIPGSRNLPWDELIDPGTMRFLPTEFLAARFAATGLDPARPIIASCGSGVTASMLVFGLYLLGHDSVAIYDGSWAEWGMAEDTPAAIGDEAGS